jgi:hypothetical protein
MEHINIKKLFLYEWAKMAATDTIQVTMISEMHFKP